mgnify:FL=1|jgi:hypothetical protein|tara:strand:- start:839 stop:1432 length:594 start_codon:yes stop_codon:yes gene_type:complete
MTGYKRHREMEVYLTTFDGAQHLRLHGWLKRNDTLIKSENIVDQDDYFGVFMVYITENQLNKLKENNTESSLFMDLEVMSTESERWNLFQSIKDKENKDNLFDKIQDFMFSFQIKDKDDIEKFLTQANNTSIALFKKSKDFIDDYIETEEMNYVDKVKDLDIMIEAFIEEERYEDCAILVKIKKKMKKYYLQKQKTE